MTQQNHNKKECNGQLLPVRDALEVLSGKWKIPIIIALSFGNIRFTELHRQLGISPKMLSKELKDLELQQLVKRAVHNTIPVSVEYSLTQYAASLEKVINALREWGIGHRQRIITGDVVEAQL